MEEFDAPCELCEDAQWSIVIAIGKKTVMWCEECAGQLLFALQELEIEPIE